MEYYSLDISGLPSAAKDYLMEFLEYVYEYSWMMNLDGTDNPMGDHYITIRGSRESISHVIQEMLDRIEGSFKPQAYLIDPDEKHEWSPLTVREKFARKYSDEK